MNRVRGSRESASHFYSEYFLGAREGQAGKIVGAGLDYWN